MNINTSNYWSTSTASSKGVSGLVSGLDTESMVEQLLSGTQTKIDDQKALKQQTEWKQDIYREIITTINDFQNKYFNTSVDASASMNFASSDFFNSMKAELTSGSGLKVVSADSSAITGDMRVKIDQLAAAAKFNSQEGHTVSSNTVAGKALSQDDLKNITNRTLVLDVGKDKDNIKKVKIDLMGCTTTQNVEKKIKESLEAADVKDVTVSTDAGVLSLKVASGSENQVKVSEDSSQLALQMSGLSKPTVSEGTDKSTIIRGTEMKPTASLSFTVSLDGVQKNITLDNLDDIAGDFTPEKLANCINDKLNAAFGKDVLVAGFTQDERGKYSLQIGYGTSMQNGGHEFRLTGSDLNALGITPGSSSHVSTSTKLGDLAGVVGDAFSFKINGVSFEFSADQTVGAMIDAINSSSAGVKLTYSSLADRFTLESASTGANYQIEMSQEAGNLLSAMFGSQAVNAGQNLITKKLTVSTIEGNALTKDITEASVQFTVNGEDYTFSLPRKDGEDQKYTAKEFEEKFNEYLQEEFGENTISYSADSGKLTITDPNLQVNITNASASGEDLGLTGKNNLATGSTKISDVLNLTQEEKGALKALVGNDATLDALTSDKDIEYKDGRLLIKTDGVADSESVKLAQKFYQALDLQSGEEVAVGNGTASEGNFTKGQDAIVSINGTKTSRSSNTFTIDGITMELTAVNKEEAVIGTTRDVDSIVKGFQEFVKDYNAMLDKLNGYLDEKTEYRDYPPLTDAQKKEMSDREIELWEEKSKTGLIHNDSSVSAFLSQMRIALYTKPEGCKFALYDIGIETSSNYKDNGKLTLDETALRNALASDASSVANLFTDSVSGLSKQLNQIMKSAANRSSGSPGVLVQLAGAEGYGTDTNNTLSRELVDIEERIKDLQDKYDKEKQRYWNQFNSMESILANFNSQSSMIQSQFGSGY